MKTPRCRAAAAITLLVALAPAARAASAAPPFEVAYRAWDVVTELARHHKDPGISGECGRTFRPFVIPGLRRQTRQEQDVAAAACVAAATAACTNGKLQKPTDTAKKCEEFR
jgi:hypothetical protein